MLKKLLISIIIFISIFAPLSVQALDEKDKRIIELRGIISELTIQLEESNTLISDQVIQLKENIVTIDESKEALKDSAEEISDLNERIKKDQEEINGLRNELDDSISDLVKNKPYTLISLVEYNIFNKAYSIDLVFGFKIPIVPVKVYTGVSVSTDLDFGIKVGAGIDF